ncbi:MAG: Gfo/Idh/MocA family oxidoreductase, partial [Anaerohalosphaera sp.]|nr:Gfo/Idh/MocA family oxidoreductase [Anaerohalosphaera sp.]
MSKVTGGMKDLSRRGFIKASAAAFGIPYMVPASVFGANAPSNRINVGAIGTGRMGRGDIMDIIGFDEVRIIAACDVDKNRVRDAKKLIEGKYAAQKASGEYKGCDMYGDYRELIARDDIDAVMICTPDHWHALPAMAAAKAGKDIFMQKPFGLTIEEGRKLSDTIRRYGNIFIVGSQQRSDQRFRHACELVRNKKIGELKSIKVGIGLDPGGSVEPKMEVPANLDYDMWLGPAPWRPYNPSRCHWNFRWIMDYSGGQLTDWAGHHIDIANWGMGTEYTA